MGDELKAIERSVRELIESVDRHIEKAFLKWATQHGIGEANAMRMTASCNIMAHAIASAVRHAVEIGTFPNAETGIASTLDVFVEPVFNEAMVAFRVDQREERRTAGHA